MMPKSSDGVCKAVKRQIEAIKKEKENKVLDIIVQKIHC